MRVNYFYDLLVAIGIIYATRIISKFFTELLVNIFGYIRREIFGIKVDSESDHHHHHTKHGHSNEHPHPSLMHNLMSNLMTSLVLNSSQPRLSILQTQKMLPDQLNLTIFIRKRMAHSLTKELISVHCLN